MKEANTSNDPINSPQVQEIILSSRIGIIAAEISRQLGVSPAEALVMFYESRTCEQLHDKSSGLYLYGNLYIVDEFMLEHGLPLKKAAPPQAPQS
ncbi:MAG: hypothetical protein Q4E59_03245 [Bacteroidales bacterium]|nr:hypothetical protein [Bacteroidales bacterium]